MVGDLLGWSKKWYSGLVEYRQATGKLGSWTIRNGCLDVKGKKKQNKRNPIICASTFQPWE